MRVSCLLKKKRQRFLTAFDLAAINRAGGHGDDGKAHYSLAVSQLRPSFCEFLFMELPENGPGSRRG